jgi:hypothetical protein
VAQNSEILIPLLQYRLSFYERLSFFGCVFAVFGDKKLIFGDAKSLQPALTHQRK